MVNVASYQHGVGYDAWTRVQRLLGSRDRVDRGFGRDEALICFCNDKYPGRANTRPGT